MIILVFIGVVSILFFVLIFSGLVLQGEAVKRARRILSGEEKADYNTIEKVRRTLADTQTNKLEAQRLWRELTDLQTKKER